MQSKCLETLSNIFQRYLQRRKFTMSFYGVLVCIAKLILNFFWFYENIYQLGVENWINNAKSWARPYHQDQNLPTNKPGQQEKLTHTYTYMIEHSCHDMVIHKFLKIPYLSRQVTLHASAYRPTWYMWWLGRHSSCEPTQLWHESETAAGERGSPLTSCFYISHKLPNDKP